MPPKQYRCCHCETAEDRLDVIIQHCIEQHGHSELKYGQLVLDDISGVLKYQTKLHEGLVPSDLSKIGENYLCPR